MTETKLICTDCGTVFDLPSREGKTCGLRLANGNYCNGTIEAKEIEIQIEPKLVCTECQRTADNLELEGKTCNFRFGTGQYCRGILEREKSTNMGGM